MKSVVVCVKDASHQNGEAVVVIDERTIKKLTCGIDVIYLTDAFRINFHSMLCFRHLFTRIMP